MGIEFHAGETRYVVLVGRFAIKIPRVDNGGRQFVLGLLANINERTLSRSAEVAGDRRLARTYFAAPLGLVAVAERCGAVIRRRLTREEALGMPLVEFSGESGVDDTGYNVARRAGGSLVVIDYGNPGLMYDPDGPRMHRGLPRDAPVGEVELHRARRQVDALRCGTLRAAQALQVALGDAAEEA